MTEFTAGSPCIKCETGTLEQNEFLADDKFGFNTVMDIKFEETLQCASCGYMPGLHKSIQAMREEFPEHGPAVADMLEQVGKEMGVL